MRPTLDAQGRPVLGPDGTAAERLGVVSGGTGWARAVGGKGRLIFLSSPILPIRRGAKRCPPGSPDMANYD